MSFNQSSDFHCIHDFALKTQSNYFQQNYIIWYHCQTVFLSNFQLLKLICPSYSHTLLLAFRSIVVR